MKILYVSLIVLTMILSSACDAEDPSANHIPVEMNPNGGKGDDANDVSTWLDCRDDPDDARCSICDTCSDDEYCRLTGCGTIDGVVARCKDSGQCSNFSPENLVCGCDGRTYQICDAQRLKISTMHTGSCDGDECSRDSHCSSNSVCVFPENECSRDHDINDWRGTCVPRVSCGDASAEDIMCGCDGRNYLNRCVAESRRAKVRHAGRCDTSD